jgi:hypothetical protein
MCLAGQPPAAPATAAEAMAMAQAGLGTPEPARPHLGRERSLNVFHPAISSA